MVTPPTTEDVQALLTVTFTTPQLQAAIDDAVLMVSDNKCMAGYSDERMTAIVKYLAAHLLSSTQQGVQGSLKSENVDGASYSLNIATVGDGLKGTSYGQQALLLDTNGCLKISDERPVKMKLL